MPECLSRKKQQIQDLVGRLYNGILLREPDFDGLKFYSDMIVSEAPLDEIIAILDRLLSSDERKGIISRIERSELTSLSLQDSQRQFEILSVGASGATATMLKRLGLREAAYPFDWIISSMAMAADCIHDNFETFLDKKYLRSIEIELEPERFMNVVDHVVFREKFNIVGMFRHHRDITLEGNFEYYVKSAQRFLDLMSSGRRAVLFCLVDGRFCEDFRKLSTSIDRFKNVSLAAVHLVRGSALNAKMVLIDERNGDAFYQYDYFGSVGSNGFESRIDEAVMRELLLRLAQGRSPLIDFVAA